MGTCGNIALDIKTYYAGQNQPTHPNVISFNKPWHGYRWYMAYTPYPHGNGYEENPCIAASNDLIHWETPSGAINPIATSEELVCDELKDSHLLYRADLDRLEMWYLGRVNGTMADGSPLRCLRKVSSDGRAWSDYEVMYTFREFNLISQSVIYDGEYRFWGIRNTREDTGLYYMHSTDGVCWSEMEKCEVPDGAQTDMWHGTVFRAEERYHFTWVGFSGQHRNRIYYANSSDGIRFSPPKVIIENDAGWEFLYRPCLLRENDRWYCYYGVIRCDGKWLITMSRGQSLDGLSGLTVDELGTTYQPVNALIGLNMKLRWNRLIKDIMKSVAPRLLLLLPLLIVCHIFCCSPLANWLLAILFSSVGSYILIEPKHIIQRGIVMGTVNACIAEFTFSVLSQLFSFAAYFFAI